MPNSSADSTKQAYSLAGLVIVCCILVMINARLGVPIWIDEFLHFALGSHNSLNEVWSTISKTTIAVNHGQTGFYMTLDYLLLKEFGANLVAMRLPSLISAFWMLFCSLMILRVLGLKPAWQFLLILLLFNQTVLLRYIGEARPYMPLAAASVGCLTYYIMPIENRKKWWVKLIGLVSVFCGVLMHPYFSLYWTILCFYTYWYVTFKSNNKINFKSLFRHMNIPLIILGSSIYFAVGAFTWMRGRPEFLFDPFHYLKRDEIFDVFINQSLFEFLAPFGSLFLGLCIFILLVYVTVEGSPKFRLKPLIPPILLIMLMMLVAFFLSFTSFITDYWILQRQWVASIAIIPIAATWFAYEVWCLIPKKFFRESRLAFVGIFLIVGFKVSVSSLEKVEDLVVYIKSDKKPKIAYSQLNLTMPLNPEEWVDLAQKNIDNGGPVWPEFRKFYRLDP